MRAPHPADTQEHPRVYTPAHILAELERGRINLANARTRGDTWAINAALKHIDTWLDHKNNRGAHR